MKMVETFFKVKGNHMTTLTRGNGIVQMTGDRPQRVCSRGTFAGTCEASRSERIDPGVQARSVPTSPEAVTELAKRKRAAIKTAFFRDQNNPSNGPSLWRTTRIGQIQKSPQSLETVIMEMEQPISVKPIQTAGATRGGSKKVIEGPSGGRNVSGMPL